MLKAKWVSFLHFRTSISTPEQLYSTNRRSFRYHSDLDSFDCLVGMVIDGSLESLSLLKMNRTISAIKELLAVNLWSFDNVIFPSVIASVHQK